MSEKKNDGAGASAAPMTNIMMGASQIVDYIRYVLQSALQYINHEPNHALIHHLMITPHLQEFERSKAFQDTVQAKLLLSQQSKKEDDVPTTLTTSGISSQQKKKQQERLNLALDLKMSAMVQQMSLQIIYNLSRLLSEKFPFTPSVAVDLRQHWVNLVCKKIKEQQKQEQETAEHHARQQSKKSSKKKKKESLLSPPQTPPPRPRFLNDDGDNLKNLDNKKTVKHSNIVSSSADDRLQRSFKQFLSRKSEQEKERERWLLQKEMQAQAEAQAQAQAQAEAQAQAQAQAEAQAQERKRKQEEDQKLFEHNQKKEKEQKLQKEKLKKRKLENKKKKEQQQQQQQNLSKMTSHFTSWLNTHETPLPTTSSSTPSKEEADLSQRLGNIQQKQNAVEKNDALEKSTTESTLSQKAIEQQVLVDQEDEAQNIQLQNSRTFHQTLKQRHETVVQQPVDNDDDEEEEGGEVFHSRHQNRRKRLKFIDDEAAEDD